MWISSTTCNFCPLFEHLDFPCFPIFSKGRYRVEKTSSLIECACPENADGEKKCPVSSFCHLHPSSYIIARTTRGLADAGEEKRLRRRMRSAGKSKCGLSWWMFAKLVNLVKCVFSGQLPVLTQTPPYWETAIFLITSQMILIKAHSWEQKASFPPKYVWMQVASLSKLTEAFVLYYTNIASFCPFPFISLVIPLLKILSQENKNKTWADCLPAAADRLKVPKGQTSWDQRQFCFKSHESWCNAVTDTSHAFSRGGQGRKKRTLIRKDDGGEVQRRG